jgi:hypothetical protein
MQEAVGRMSRHGGYKWGLSLIFVSHLLVVCVLNLEDMIIIIANPKARPMK